MQTREITRLGVSVSRLGFGAMRMPTRDGKIDEALALEMVDYLQKSGVTYYDTALFYHDGESEPFLKRALVDRYPRDSYTIATKLPLSNCQAPEDMAGIFASQLAKLGLSAIDFYLLHGIGAADWEKAKALGAPGWLRRLKEGGSARFVGFSYHDLPDALPAILDDYPWDFCQIQLNYADWYQRGGAEMYNALAARGIPIIVMEPVRGGGLTQLYPDMRDLLDALDPSVSPASWALRFCAGLPHVDVVLSGMSTMGQCVENVGLFSDPPPLTAPQQDALRRIALAFDQMPTIPCTECRYCAGCPSGIDIPKLFTAYNNHMRYQGSWELSYVYKNEVPDDRKATACTRCGACEDICPQKIAVMDELGRVHKVAEGLWE
ncbi:MAG: aldo/keto reductase [Oscillospiraceae bacterium]|nr:aldo/keto reductase [Oscillospiraceae bacterium]